jgi:hypothetical protein
MNFFYYAAVGDVEFDVLTRLINLYKPDECFVAYHVKNAKNAGIVLKNEESGKPVAINGSVISEAYDVRGIEHMLYEGYKYETECPAVDEKLLKSMNAYESTIMKLLDRCVFGSDKVPSYEERVRTYHNHLRYWDYVLSVANIDMVIFTAVPHRPVGYILYCLCKIKRIATVICDGQTIAGLRCFYTDIENSCNKIMETYQRLTNELRDTPIDEITLHPQQIQQVYNKQIGEKQGRTPFYVTGELNLIPKISKKRRSFLTRVIGWLRQAIGEKPISTSSIKTQVALKVSQRRVIKLSKLLDKSRSKLSFLTYKNLFTHADYSAPYIYFPLHYQPEATTCPLGGVYAHQILAIKMLSSCLPTGYKIYVKENIHQKWIYRETQMYYDLAELPNVELMPLSENTFDLIEHCLAVATVTGTAGFEGLFSGKPFLMFGWQIYISTPGTFNIRNNEDCKEALDYIIKNGAKHTIKDMKIWLKAVGEETQHCSWLYSDEKMRAAEGLTSITFDDNAERFVNGYSRIINELFPALNIDKTTEYIE